MIKKLVGGAITLVIGGTAYTITQSSVTNNFAKNTGMTQQQAQTYVNNAQKNLQSFSKIGQEYVSDGSSVANTASQIDCSNYSYQWETNSLSCSEGQSEMQTLASDENQLGNCYESLGTNLGNASNSKIRECINDIDVVNSDYSLPIAQAVMSSSDISTQQNSDQYNKSVLQAALQSN